MELPGSGERLKVVSSMEMGSRSLGLPVNLMMADQKSQGNKLIPAVNQAMAVSSNFFPSQHPKSPGAALLSSTAPA